MDTLTFYQDSVEKIIQEHAVIPDSRGEIKQYVIVDRDRTHFLLFNEGWVDRKRVHGCVTHVQIVGDKIWIHFDILRWLRSGSRLPASPTKPDVRLSPHPAPQ